MYKRHLIFIFFSLLFLPTVTYSQMWKQRRYEFAMSLGSSNFYGDIGGAAEANNLYGLKDIQLKYTRPSTAISIRYKLNGDMNLKMNFIYGFLAGDDAQSRNSERKYSFTSTIFEPSLQFEYYLIPESRSRTSSAIFNRKGMLNNYSKIYAYVFGGAGGVISNPKLINSLGNPVVIADIKKFGLTFPVGAGVKYTLDANWSLGLEFGRRFTTTDYIDGYTSKFSKHKDLYDFVMFSAIYKVPTDRRGFPILSVKRKYRR